MLRGRSRTSDLMLRDVDHLVDQVLVHPHPSLLARYRVDRVLAVTTEGLPVEAGSPISDDLRRRGIDVVKGLVASGKVDLDRFEQAVDGLLGVRTEAEFAAVVRSLPPPVEFTPPERRSQESLEINTSMNAVRLAGRWQVGRLTRIQADMGSVTIDLSEAEFEGWDIDLVVHTGMGTITVVVPSGLGVQLVGGNGAVETALDPPIPGFPLVRLSATSDMGTIRVVHPMQRTRRRRRWRRSRGRP